MILQTYRIPLDSYGKSYSTLNATIRTQTITDNHSMSFS